MTTLPHPVTELTPLGPPGWLSHPGGYRLPSLGTSFSPNAPVIGYHSEQAWPNETVSLCGRGLAEATYLCWSEGGTCEIRPFEVETIALS